MFYDVTEKEVRVLAVISKAAAQAWLDEPGVAAAPGSPGEGEG